VLAWFVLIALRDAALPVEEDSNMRSATISKTYLSIPLLALGLSVALPARALDVSPEPQRIQPNGDWERHPIAVHVPLGLSWLAPFGSLDGHPRAAMSENVGTFTSFELGVGLRVRRLVIDGIVFSIGGAALNDGAVKEVIQGQGFDAHSPLRVFFGSEVAYYLVRTQHWAPWLGARVGYDGLMFGSNAGENVSMQYSFGGIYAALRAGADWRLAPAFGLGAALELGAGRYLSGKASVDYESNPSNPSSVPVTVSEADLDLAGGANHGFVGVSTRVVFFP
jgi:hypothetical protein